MGHQFFRTGLSIACSLSLLGSVCYAAPERLPAQQIVMSEKAGAEQGAAAPATDKAAEKSAAVTKMAVSPIVGAASKKAIFSSGQKAAIEEIVHDYLLENPQVLVEVSQKLQAQEQTKLEDKAQQAIADNQTTVFFDKNNPVIGNPDGDISLVEFFDYQCIHCKEEAPVVAELIKKNPRLRVVLKDLPIFGRNSRYASLMSLAVFQSMKDKSFERFHRALFALPAPLTETKIQEAAKSVGLDIEKLAALIKAPEYNQQIDRNYQLADQIGITGTPAFIIARTGSGSAEETKKLKVFFVPGAADQETLQQLISHVQK